MESNLLAVFGSNPTLTSVALGVIIITIAGFVTGQIVPKWTVKSLLESRSERVVQANLRAEDYKRLYETEHAALETVRGQVTELLVAAQATKKLVDALPVPRTEGVSS